MCIYKNKNSPSKTAIITMRNLYPEWTAQHRKRTKNPFWASEARRTSDVPVTVSINIGPSRRDEIFLDFLLSSTINKTASICVFIM